MEPNRREPRRSILKDIEGWGHRVSVGQGQGRRKSSLRPPGVRFEKNVEIINKIIKISGIDGALEDQVRKLKVQRQIRCSNGPAGHVPIYQPAHLPKEEVFPLHIKDPLKRRPPPMINQLPLKLSEEEVLESRRARQNLARIYFAQEATRIVAASNFGTVGKSASVLKERLAKKKTILPHFFMDRLAADKQEELNRKKMEKVKALRNEMDAFDDIMFSKKENPPPPSGTCSTFDPTEIQPTERSMINLKLKVEILRRQKERDVQAAEERNRCRKAYFREKILPSRFPGTIEEEITEFAFGKGPTTISPEEVELNKEIDEVVKKCRVLEENRIHYDREHLKFSPGKTQQFCKDIMDVILNVVVESSEYKTVTGHEPSQALCAQWREHLFAWMDDPTCEKAEAAATSLSISRDVADILVEVAMNQSDYKGANGEEPLQSMIQHWRDTFFASWISFPECNNESDADASSGAGSTRQTINSIIDSVLDAVIKINEYKAEHGEEPSASLCQEWRDKFFASIHGIECDTEEEETGGQIAKNIINVLLDCVEKISDYRHKTGIQPSENMCQEWREQLFASLYDSECECSKAAEEETSEEIAQVMLDVILDNVIKSSEYRYHMKNDPPCCLTEEWRDEIFAALQSHECGREDYVSEQIIRDVLEVIQEIKRKDYFSTNKERPADTQCQEWREYFYNIMNFVPCRSSRDDEYSRLTELMVRDILDEIVDAVTKISECREKGNDLSSDSECLLWKERGFLDDPNAKVEPQEETQYQYCIRVMQETDDFIREILEELVDAAVNVCECRKSKGQSSTTDSVCQRVEYNIPSPPETSFTDEKDGEGPEQVALTVVD